MTEPGLLYGECYAVHFTGDNAIILLSNTIVAFM